MAITVDNNPNVITYSIQEDATPINPNDTGAGFGQVTYSLQTQIDSEWDIETETEVYDSKRGIFAGVIKDIGNADGLLNVTVDSALSALSRWHTVYPYGGTVKGYAKYVSSVVGLVPPIAVDPTIATRNILAPGYVGNVWEGIKDFLSANELEITSIDGVITIRPIRKHNVLIHNEIAHNWTLNSQGSAERLKVHWRETDGMRTNITVFPSINGEKIEPISVDANETIEQEITIDGSLRRINQPKVVDYVAANTNADGSQGTYCVSGSDGKPILADRWIKSGGQLRVELTDNPSIIKVIVTGGSVEEYAPYRIAATAGTSSYYNSLHITGDGMRWRNHDFTMNTGAGKSTDSDETPVELDNVNILSLEQAYTGALRAASALRGGIKTINGTAVSLDGEGTTQPLGGRVTKGFSRYRVSTLTIAPNNVQYDLLSDTLISDYNAIIAGKKVSNFNSLYAGRRIMDFNNQPLRGIVS